MWYRWPRNHTLRALVMQDALHLSLCLILITILWGRQSFLVYLANDNKRFLELKILAQVYPPGKWQMRDCDSAQALHHWQDGGYWSLYDLQQFITYCKKGPLSLCIKIFIEFENQSPGTLRYFLLWKKFAPAQDKDEFFLVTAALNQKHNNSNRYKNKEMRACSHHPGPLTEDPFPLWGPGCLFPWDPYPSSVFAFMNQLTFWLFPKAFCEKWK